MARQRDKGVVDTLTHTIAGEDETLCEAVSEVEAEDLVDNVDARIAVVKVKTLEDKLTELETKALIDTLADRIEDVEVHTLN